MVRNHVLAARITKIPHHCLALIHVKDFASELIDLLDCGYFALWINFHILVAFVLETAHCNCLYLMFQAHCTNESHDSAGGLAANVHVKKQLEVA